MVFWLTDPGLLQSRMLRSQNVWSYHAASTQVTNVKPAFYIGGKEIEYVDSWPHLGNLVHTRPSCNDRHDIVSKKNSLCVQINNVLCYFGRRDPITKLWWMRTYCSSFYGSVLWDLTNPSVEEVCAMLRKGLWRVWNIPRNTHSNLLGDTVPLRDELSWWFINFMHSCLTSDSDSVRFVANHGVFGRRTATSIAGQATWWCWYTACIQTSLK